MAIEKRDLIIYHELYMKMILLTLNQKNAIKCHKCKSKVSMSHKYCYKCGTKLNQENIQDLLPNNTTLSNNSTIIDGKQLNKIIIKYEDNTSQTDTSTNIETIQETQNDNLDNENIEEQTTITKNDDTGMNNTTRNNPTKNILVENYISINKFKDDLKNITENYKNLTGNKKTLYNKYLTCIILNYLQQSYLFEYYFIFPEITNNKFKEFLQIYYSLDVNNFIKSLIQKGFIEQDAYNFDEFCRFNQVSKEKFQEIINKYYLDFHEDINENDLERYYDKNVSYGKIPEIIDFIQEKLPLNIIEKEFPLSTYGVTNLGNSYLNRNDYIDDYIKFLLTQNIFDFDEYYKKNKSSFDLDSITEFLDSLVPYYNGSNKLMYRNLSYEYFNAFYSGYYVDERHLILLIRGLISDIIIFSRIDPQVYAILISIFDVLELPVSDIKEIVKNEYMNIDFSKNFTINQLTNIVLEIQDAKDLNQINKDLKRYLKN